MTTGLNVRAFRDLIVPLLHERMAEYDRLMRTQKGRKQLAAEYRQRARDLRDFAARGDFRSHCPWPTAEPYLKKAAELEAEAARVKRLRFYRPLFS